MKFASFERGGKAEIGVMDEGGTTIRPLGSRFADMVELIRAGGSFDEASLGGERVALGEVRLLAPIPAPRRNIFCVGKNYREHAKEFARSGYEAGAVAGVDVDEYPAVFTKGANCVVGPDATVELHPQATEKVDYEAELALVIGKGGRNIRKADAYAHVFGYTIINDVTARDRQKNHKQWFLGKSLDTFAPMGPWIVTADEVDPENMEVKCRVNGELRQNANTRDLIFDIPTLIAAISAGLTLEPGDIIATGTPAGVGIGRNPPEFLKAGDTVSIEISGIGTLSNRFA